MTEPAAVDSPPAPPAAPAAPAPTGPSADEVRALIREELAGFFSGLGQPPAGAPAAPDLSTDKKMEEYVEKIVQDSMAKLGTPPPDATIDTGTPPPVDPEKLPETKAKWQDKVRAALWGE